MPWKASDAKRFTKAADTAKKQRQWVAVANSALSRCLADGGKQETCESSAIKQANSVVAKEAEVREYSVGLQGFISSVRGAFGQAFNPPREDKVEYAPWVKDVLVGHSELGDAVIVDDRVMC